MSNDEQDTGCGREVIRSLFSTPNQAPLLQIMAARYIICSYKKNDEMLQLQYLVLERRHHVQLEMAELPGS